MSFVMRYVLVTMDQACFNPSQFSGVSGGFPTKKAAERAAAAYIRDNDCAAEGDGSGGWYVGIVDLKTGEGWAVLDNWDEESGTK
jgi:hypothetical protein